MSYRKVDIAHFSLFLMLIPCLVSEKQALVIPIRFRNYLTFSIRLLLHGTTIAYLHLFNFDIPDM